MTAGHDPGHGPGRLPDRAALDAALTGAASPQAALRELIGERQLWWKCCREAVRADPSWLFDGRGQQVLDWLRATAPEQMAGAFTNTEHAWRISRALAGSADRNGEHARELSGLVEDWKRSRLLSADAAPGPAQPSGRGLESLSPDVAARLKSVVELLQDGVAQNGVAQDAQQAGSASVLIIAALEMVGAQPRRRPVVAVPVVFGTSAGAARTTGTAGHPATEVGVVGVLELREFPAGPAGLYPDPQTMAGMHSLNGQFADSLGHAWAVAGPRRAGRCVLWRLVVADGPGPPTRISGPSLGAAFALGLRELLRYPPSHRPSVAWVRSTFRGLRPRTAVTGALDGSEQLLKVADMESKLLAARRKGWRLVAPVANRLDVAAAPEPGEVKFAANLRQADRYARRIRTGRLAAAALVLAAATTGGYALQQRMSADAEQRAALASRIATEADQLRATDPATAAQLDLIAYRMAPGSNPYTNLVADGNAILPASVQAHTLMVDSVAYASSRHLLASMSEDGTIKLWSLADPARPALLGQPLANSTIAFSVAFSPDGRTMASGGYNSKARLWDVTDPVHPKALGQPIGAYGAVAFSPDGHTLASGNGGGAIGLWNITDPGHPVALPQTLTGETGFVVSLAFSPNGQALVASGNDDSVNVWDLTKPSQAPAPLNPPNASKKVYRVVLSPDGRTVATSNDGRVWLWDVSDPGHPKLDAHYLNIGGVDSDLILAFSPDSQTLAVGSIDHTVELWDVGDPASPAGLPATLVAGSGLSSLAFSPDGRTLAGGTVDGRVTMWSLPGRRLPPQTIDADGMAFSPDSHVLATGDDNGTVTLWDVSDPAAPRALSHIHPGTGEITDLAFSPDGRTLAVGDLDGILVRLDVADPGKPETVGQPLSLTTDGRALALSLNGETAAGWTSPGGDETKAVTKVWSLADPAHPTVLGQLPPRSWLAASSDGRTIASNDSKVTLWTTAQPGQPVDLGGSARAENDAGPLAFSRDGRFLASADGARTTLWNITDSAHPATVGTGAVRSNVRSLAFSPDDRTLAVGGADGAVRFLDPRQLTAPSQALVGQVGDVFGLAFSPDGRVLASTATDHTVELWDMDVDDAARWICATTRGLTAEQWQKYAFGAPFDPPCSSVVGVS